MKHVSDVGRRLLVKNPLKPTIADANNLAAARLRVGQGVVTKDPILTAYLFCSPRRDDDSVKRCVRRHQQNTCSLISLWLSVVAWRAFGTERFVDALGTVLSRSLTAYVNIAVSTALRVWAEGFHAFSNAYGTSIRIMWGRERTCWRLRGSRAERANLSVLVGIPFRTNPHRLGTNPLLLW